MGCKHVTCWRCLYGRALGNEKRLSRNDDGICGDVAPTEHHAGRVMSRPLYLSSYDLSKGKEADEGNNEKEIEVFFLSLRQDPEYR